MPLSHIQIDQFRVLLIGLVASLTIGCSPMPPADSGTHVETGVDQPESKTSTAPDDALAEGSVKISEDVSYFLEDGESHHQEVPDTFWIPPASERTSLESEQVVKLMFQITANGEAQTERMWVIVQESTEDGYVGALDNDACTKEMKSGLSVRFQPRHVIEIYDGDSE